MMTLPDVSTADQERVRVLIINPREPVLSSQREELGMQDFRGLAGATAR